MLRDKDILVKPQEASRPVKIDTVTLSHLIALHAHGIYVADINPDNQRVKFKIKGDYFSARYGGPSADLHVMIETYVDALYDGDYSGMSVIDIGGYIGETAILFAQKGAKRIFCVEPAPDNLILLHQNVSQSSLQDRIVIIEAAVMSGDGRMGFYTDQAHYSAFHAAEFHEIMRVYLSDAVLIDVEAISFGRLLEYTGLEEVDLVKMDCEGAEYDILLNTPESVLRRVRRYIIEYHNGSDSLVKRLNSLGYKVNDKLRFGQIGLIYAEQS